MFNIISIFRIILLFTTFTLCLAPYAQAAGARAIEANNHDHNRHPHRRHLYPRRNTPLASSSSVTPTGTASAVNGANTKKCARTRTKTRTRNRTKTSDAIDTSTSISTTSVANVVGYHLSTTESEMATTTSSSALAKPTSAAETQTEMETEMAAATTTGSSSVVKSSHTPTSTSISTSTPTSTADSATFFTVGLGNCGATNSTDAPVVALYTTLGNGDDAYNGGVNCGKEIIITHQKASGESITQSGWVWDSCPTCNTDGTQIDLGETLWNFFGESEDMGVLQITWSCPDCVFPSGFF